ncbi:hypothetical protein D3C87_465880 [compost metagenome]
MSALIERLLAAGFVETQYEGQQDHFVTKKFKMKEFPELTDHGFEMVETEEEEYEVVVEYVVEGNQVQLLVLNDWDDDVVEPVPVNSEIGLAMLKLAGVDMEGL